VDETQSQFATCEDVKRLQERVWRSYGPVMFEEQLLSFSKQIYQNFEDRFQFLEEDFRTALPEYTPIALHKNALQHIESLLVPHNQTREELRESAQKFAAFSIATAEQIGSKVDLSTEMEFGHALASHGQHQQHLKKMKISMQI